MQIELYSKLQNPIEAIDRIGEIFAKSGMFGCDRVEQGRVLAMICLAEGKSPVQITTNYHIVEGKLSKKALAALADFRNGGGKHRWLKSGDEPTEKEADRFAELEITDREGNKITYRYSMADARAEGLVKDKSRWVKRPGNMLRARCISNGLGMLCPELYAGEDSEHESQSEPAPLLPTRESAPVTRTIEVVAEPVKEAEVVKVATATEAKPETDTLKIEADATGHLTAASVQALESAIGADNATVALAWLTQRGWIKTSLLELSVDRANKIITKPASQHPWRAK